MAYEKDEDLNTVLSKGISGNHPYFFAIKQKNRVIFELYEIQIYSQKIIWISTWDTKNNKLISSDENALERRQNFNGATLRVSFSERNEAKEMELFSLFQKKFNFTMDKKPFHGFGVILDNGTRTGAIYDIIENNIDLGKNASVNS